MTSPHFTIPLLTTEQAAQILGIKPNTLENWRCTKRVSLPYVKVGRSIRYRQADLQKFIEDSGHD